MSTRAGLWTALRLHAGYYGYVAGAAVASGLPERTAYGLAELAGSLWARAAPARRGIVAANLAQVTGEPLGSARLEALIHEAFRSYARYWLEMFRGANQDKQYFLERFHCDAEEHLRSVLERGAGALLVVGHLGNWDAAAGWLGAGGRPPVTVAEVVRPRRLFDFLVERRARLGVTVYPAEKGSGPRLVDALARGRVVAVLGDRDLKGRGPEVDFFGARTTFPAGPASIALKAGVPILVAGVYGVSMSGGRRGWWAEISKPIELPAEPTESSVTDLTRAVARELERHVARAPEQWHVFQPFWPQGGEGAGPARSRPLASAEDEAVRP